MRQYHKPVKRPGDFLEALGGSGDPAAVNSLAHDTAISLLHRVRSAGDPVLVDAVIAYADEHGVDDVAELWSASGPDTLPGALWRIYLLRHTITQAPEEAGYRFRRGLEMDTVGHAIVGSADAPTPQEVADLATQILRGVFAGDFAVALERAAAFARVMAVGASELASGASEETAVAEARRVEGFNTMAMELAGDARLWREGKLI